MFTAFVVSWNNLELLSALWCIAKGDKLSSKLSYQSTKLSKYHIYDRIIKNNALNVKLR